MFDFCVVKLQVNIAVDSCNAFEDFQAQHQIERQREDLRILVQMHLCNHPQIQHQEASLVHQAAYLTLQQRNVESA